MKRVGIIYHPLNKGARSLAQEIAGFLGSGGTDCWLGSAWESDELKGQAAGSDLILAIGGDGTILRTAQAVAPHSIPIAGINMGKFGFLTELAAEEAMDKLPALMAGEGWLDERAMLEANFVSDEGEQKTAGKLLALNDIVVARGEVARIIYIEASIDGEPLATYKADGVIVASATGSTGYSLSAGGPILNPQAEDFLLVPILPYLSLRHPLVLPAKTTVKLKVGAIHRAVLSIDGHISLPLAGGATVIVKHSPVKTRFLRVSPRDSFYSTLERRLKG